MKKKIPNSIHSAFIKHQANGTVLGARNAKTKLKTDPGLKELTSYYRDTSYSKYVKRKEALTRRDNQERHRRWYKLNIEGN